MNLFNSKETKPKKNMNILAKVDQLTSFDMIYVYHLLSIGSKLKLSQSEQKLNGDLVYNVMFNSFKLGYITVSSFSKMLFTDKMELDASVFGLAKEKYLPLKSLEISIHQKALKMVS